jgi:hypothetical protein
MTNRLVTYSLVFFFVFSSLAYACPDLNSNATNHHDASIAEMASDDVPCHGSDHDSNPLCRYILHERISYTSAGFSLDHLIAHTAVYLPASQNGFVATTVFHPGSAGPPHLKLLHFTLLYRVLRV